MRRREEELARRIQEEVQKIQEEEDRMWDEIIRDPNVRFPVLDANDAAVELPFNVYVTRYGSVYHTTRNCGYLRAPTTGVAQESKWCSLCKMVALRTRGVPPPGCFLWIEGMGRDIHTSRRCPRLNQIRLMPLCSQCPQAV